MINRTPPLVTIGMPTYNRANNYLKQAIQCAVNQTYPNIEIIVSDNCSSDNTETLFKSFNNPMIKYFRQSRNIGGQNNVQFCLEQAQGDYFLLLHDDDLIDDDFVKVCIEAADYDTSYGIILTGTRVIDENGTVLQGSTNEAEECPITDFILKWFDHKVPLYLCSTLYNTRRLKELGGFRSKYNLYEDNIVLFQLAAKFGRKDVHDVKASFRRHSDNIGSAAHINEWCEDSLHLLNVICDVVPDNKELLKSRGLNYFSVDNYIRAARIQSPFKRFYAYLIVYKNFEYSYSPFHYIFAKNIIYRKAFRALRYLKRKTK
ncbi:MAG: glycosyltransferase [Candidatus Scalindua sp.]|nr:glycosyltransferase [Candidatus Scalindua sp.]